MAAAEACRTSGRECLCRKTEGKNIHVEESEQLLTDQKGNRYA